MRHSTPCILPRSATERGEKLPVRPVFWLSISRQGLDCDDIAVEGIFRVADTKLCFHLNWCVRLPTLNGCVRDGAALKQRGKLFQEGWIE